MTVEKITFRLPPRDMCRPEDGTFQTHYEARVDRALASLDLNEVFQDVGMERIQAGDQITFCAFEGNMLAPERRLREIGVCRIIAKITENGRVRVKAAWVGEIWKVPADQAVAPKEQKYKLSVKGEFEGDFTVRDEKDNLIERVNTKEEAEAFIAVYDGKPKAKGPGRPPKPKEEGKGAAA